jgi:hypothetical protein
MKHGARYKDTKPYFEFECFEPHINLFPKINFFTLFSDFLFKKKKTTHFGIGRHENKENQLFYFSLGIISPTILNCKNLKIQKSTSPARQ